ncbi:MAG: hypothetical protein ACYDD6_02295 [Acidimicrobiales bacterium]
MTIRRKLLTGAMLALPVAGVSGLAYAGTPTTPTLTIPSHTDATEAPGAAAKSDGPGGHQDVNGANTNFQSGAPDATEATGTATKADGPGGANVNSQSGPDIQQ